MTQEEAVKWAVINLKEALKFEYYKDKAPAMKAAEAMSVLDKKPWTIKGSTNLELLGAFWVVPE